jgi:hypothetical protein
LVDKTALPGIIEGIDARDGNSIILYGMYKHPKLEWNFLIGGRFNSIKDGW